MSRDVKVFFNLSLASLLILANVNISSVNLETLSAASNAASPDKSVTSPNSSIILLTSSVAPSFSKISICFSKFSTKSSISAPKIPKPLEFSSTSFKESLRSNSILLCNSNPFDTESKVLGAVLYSERYWSKDFWEVSRDFVCVSKALFNLSIVSVSLNKSRT